MYCKHCGQPIENDSIFCKHCGKKVNAPCESISKDTSESLFSKFTSLPKKYQNTIIIFALWLLGWICVLIANFDKSNFASTYLMTFFLCAIILPFAICSAYYLYQLNKKQPTAKEEEQNNKKINFSEQARTSTVADSKEISTPHDSAYSRNDNDKNNTDHKHVVRTELLLSFAHINGKMQIINKKSEDSSIADHYCLFTNHEGVTTRVDFNSETKSLTSKEISEKKFLLCIKQYDNGNYELAYINGKEVVDTLPF